MEMRTLGRSGIEVSALGLGSSAFGGIFGRRSEAEIAQTLNRALDLGVNLIDTAPSYGNGRAEEMIGRHLRHRRESAVLATKVGCYAEHDFDFSEPRIRRELESSLRRLQTDRVDILFAHDIEHGDPGQILHETLPLLLRLREEGKARAVGVSGLPLEALAAAVGAGDLDVILSYCRYGLHDQSLRRLEPICRGAGCAVLTASPLAMGLLSTKGPPQWHPAPQPLLDAARQAERLCREHGSDLADLAMRFALDQSWIASVLTGTARAEHLEANLRSLEEPADEELLCRVREVFSQVETLSWPSGRPSWKEAPCANFV